MVGAAAAVVVALVGTAPGAEPHKDILASAQGHDLPRRQVEGAIVFLEFLAGGPFSPEEHRLIVAEARTDFLLDPASELHAYASLEDAARRAEAFKGDKVKEAEFRENTIAAIHLDLLSKPPKERDTAATRALFRRVPVIATDPASRHVVTKRGLDALLDANDFVAGLVGYAKTDAATREKIMADVAATFGAMPIDDRAVLAHGASRRARLQAFWSALTTAERAGVVEELKRTVRRPDDVPVAARRLETTARLALLGRRINRSMGRIMDVESGTIALDVMRGEVRSFGK